MTSFRTFLTTRATLSTPLPLEDHRAFWAEGATDVLARLGTTPAGLGAQEAARRLAEHGPNRRGEHAGQQTLRLVLRQLESPLVLLLVPARSFLPMRASSSPTRSTSTKPR